MSAGKGQRNPVTGKGTRRPATGRTPRNTASISTCCCAGAIQCGADAPCSFSGHFPSALRMHIESITVCTGARPSTTTPTKYLRTQPEHPFHRRPNDRPMWLPKVLQYSRVDDFGRAYTDAVYRCSSPHNFKVYSDSAGTILSGDTPSLETIVTLRRIEVTPGTFEYHHGVTHAVWLEGELTLTADGQLSSPPRWNGSSHGANGLTVAPSPRKITTFDSLNDALLNTQVVGSTACDAGQPWAFRATGSAFYATGCNVYSDSSLTATSYVASPTNQFNFSSISAACSTNFALYPASITLPRTSTLVPFGGSGSTPLSYVSFWEAKAVSNAVQAQIRLEGSPAQWVLAFACGGGSFCPDLNCIWYGTKAGSATPAGTYSRVGGMSANPASITVS